MARETLEVVRVPLTVGVSSRRRLDERLLVRYPALVALGVRAGLHLPPRSRLRNAGLRRVGRLLLEAYNRGDLDAAYALYRRDADSTLPHQLVAVGFEPVARGRAGIIDFQRRRKPSRSATGRCCSGTSEAAA